MDILGIVGSLRRESYNKAVFRAAQDLAPDGMTLTEHQIGDIPLFNADVEAAGDPPSVARFKDAIAAADGLLIITPEYQHGVPGLLKNALDWASRPAGDAVLQSMPVAVMGASPGMTGTARAQSQLRQTLVYNACRVLPPPEVLIAKAHERIEDGQLTDETTRGFVQDALARFGEWVDAYGRGR